LLERIRGLSEIAGAVGECRLLCRCRSDRVLAGEGLHLACELLLAFREARGLLGELGRGALVRLAALWLVPRVLTLIRALLAAGRIPRAGGLALARALLGTRFLALRTTFLTTGRILRAGGLAFVCALLVALRVPCVLTLARGFLAARGLALIRAFPVGLLALVTSSGLGLRTALLGLGLPGERLGGGGFEAVG
jgi:hypothetical protein